jgi:multiple sugar transport system permease protein
MRTWVRVVVCTVIALVMVFPVYAMVVVSLTPKADLYAGGAHLWPSQLTLSNFSGLFRRFPLGQWFTNSVLVAAITTALSVTVNLLAGYALAKVRFAGRSALFLLVLSTLMIPTQAIMIPQFRVVSAMGLYGTFWAVILPSAATALGIFLARQFMLSVPDELLEAARVDGAGNLKIFLRIVLPLSKPLIAVMVLIAFMGQWNDFLWPLITLKDPALYTLPVAMRFLQGQFVNDYGALMAMALMASLPLVVLFLFLQRFFVEGLTRSGIK